MQRNTGWCWLPGGPSNSNARVRLAPAVLVQSVWGRGCESANWPWTPPRHHRPTKGASDKRSEHAFRILRSDDIKRRFGDAAPKLSIDGARRLFAHGGRPEPTPTKSLLSTPALLLQLPTGISEALMLGLNVCRNSLRVASKGLHLFVPSSLAFAQLHTTHALFSNSTKVEGSSATSEEKSDLEKTHSLTQAAEEGRKFKAPHEASKKIPANFDLNSIFLLSIPITTHRSFIYCHHNAGLLNKDQLSRVSWLVKLEEKLVALAVKAWDKLVTSDLTINKKIVALVLRLLNSVPYNESCLRSFPSEEAMVRETNEHQSHGLPRALMKAEIDANNVSLEHLKPIPVYHSKIQDPAVLLKQMHQFKTDLVARHSKWAVICAIGIPISLPIALVPLAPNVPGFYLTYRLYCHIQALRGAKNLGFLLESETANSGETESSVVSSTHLTFKHHPDLDHLFASAEVEGQEQEKLLLDSNTVDRIVETTGLVEIKEDLYRAFKQERGRLAKERNA
ncbi:hypothetical protein METBIDRAFT_10437 [Metschnikowia bicuspidata var. bicuspidata NRRL YB-4993]|uniref:Uncharacterized protein n=1 Tax=Metschnikowia bicuspidata var. bicuspidata NRRL YB-4993 TaxID=869754 RepID=A0A1A0HJV9_9ASCO|nr:hypothetical protein METBIDRAFT_10437 [Metschnikowia bicuspidata var. bicuspidata NRRL YB-4993]OBA24286.1 hypothetical protein METBIDRAFT_10437 [Metschnikowia bicuspidata var. bicuspidata NRRL YB-4993]